MAGYLGDEQYAHDQPERTGVLLVNLGTPDAPTPSAVRRYLREFLWDPRVIEVPRLLWWCILQVILVIRPARSAAAYAKVWTPEGSPLLVNSQRQRAGLAARLQKWWGEDGIEVALGMRYGSPSIEAALTRLHARNVRRLLVLPLYPQYAASTTGATFDAVSAALRRWRWLPELRFVTRYDDQPGYIEAVAASIRAHHDAHGTPDRLLFSFHGLPRRYLEAGDPYHCQCHRTARLVAETLGLAAEDWALSFQSRVGREEWLRPYTDELLMQWGAAGIETVHVVCPGFSSDCLETLEEIAMLGAEQFVGAGGGRLRYIPALNDAPAHLEALESVVTERIADWHRRRDADGSDDAAAARVARATALGAPR